MRRKTILLLVLQLISHLVWAQFDLQTHEGRVLERNRLEAKQRELEAIFDARDAACKTKFAVTPCRSDVRLERIRSLDEIKRQLSALNRADRQAAAAKQLLKLEEKRTGK